MAENGKITAPVTVLDIARTIGVASVDLGRLCTSDNVNKWSRYKPIGSTTANVIPQSEFKTYKEGGVSKPFGLLMPVPVVGEFKTYLQAGMGDVEYLEVDALNRASVWEYAQPQKSSEVIGTIKGKTIYGTENNYRCRKADFNGYVHRAEPLFNVKWSIIDGSIVCDVRLGSVEGGITLEDMGLNGKVLNLIAVSKNKIAIKYGDKASDNRYVVGINVDNWMDAALYDTMKTYRFVLQAWRIDPILNDMVLFLAVTDTPLRYKLSAESEEDGIYKNPDGFTKDNVYYYPIVDDAQDITGLCVVENSFFEVKMSGGIGNVLWSQSTNGIDSEGNSEAFSMLEYSGTFSPDNGDYLDLNDDDRYKPTGQVYIQNNGFDVKITELGYTESRSALRKFSITGERKDSVTNMTYLNMFDDNQTKGTIVYKPLLRGLSVNDRWGVYRKASIYIKFVYGDNTEGGDKYLVLRYTLSDGTTDERILFQGKFNDNIDNQTYMYHSISMANVVDTFNNVTGFKLVLKRTSGFTLNSGQIKETVIDSWYSDEEGHYFPILPKVRVNNEKPDEIVDYGDLHFRLPDDIETKVARKGRFRASYEVITSDTESSIGV